MDIKDTSLRKAFEATKCRDLPKQYREGNGVFWIKAIVLVRKRNGTQSYALAERRGDLHISVTQDFGLMSPIAGIVSIHPYIYLDADRFLNFGSEEQRINALIRHYGTERAEEIKSATKEKLDIMAIDMAIRNQLENKEADITANLIAESINPTRKRNAEESVEETAAEGAEVMHTDSGVATFKVVSSARKGRPKKNTE